MSFFLEVEEVVTPAGMGVFARNGNVAEASVALVHKSAATEYVDLVHAVLRMWQLLT